MIQDTDRKVIAFSSLMMPTKGGRQLPYLVQCTRVNYKMEANTKLYVEAHKQSAHGDTSTIAYTFSQAICYIQLSQ